LLISFDIYFLFLSSAILLYYFTSCASSEGHAVCSDYRTVPVQKHLEKVYLTLSAALLVSALGTYVNILTGLGGFVAAIGFVVFATWLTVTEPTALNLNKR
jgi:FtsH-binding integral membrane protein